MRVRAMRYTLVLGATQLGGNVGLLQALGMLEQEFEHLKPTLQVRHLVVRSSVGLRRRHRAPVRESLVHQ